MREVKSPGEAEASPGILWTGLRHHNRVFGNVKKPQRYLLARLAVTRNRNIPSDGLALAAITP